ncbi:MAG: peptidase M16 [Bacteroidetes bacterium]|nr:MAG: peptidase M16 [Bacteroidota bacterium]
MTNSTYQYHTLPSGLRIVHKESAATVAHCGIIIDTGSRDEQTDEHGIAHFIEHVIFKGTTRRKAFHILSRMDNVGGDINAYTTKEETGVYASFLPEYYGRAIELFGDILFHSTFPLKEIEKEKDVVYDEITSYLDTPWEQIIDDFEDQLFAGHTLGRNILGTPERLESITREAIFAFIARNYHPKQMVLCSVGKISMKRLIRMAERYLTTEHSFEKKIPRAPLNQYLPQKRIVERNSFQTHIAVGNRAFPWRDKRRATLALLTNYLGGPAMNTRLNMAIREKYGITYNIEAQYTPYSDTGVFSVYMGTDPTNAERALHLLHREFQHSCHKIPGSNKLHIAKKQFKGQLAIAQESNLMEMLSMGKSVLIQGRVDSMEQLYAQIDAITALEFMDTANAILAENLLSTLIFKGSEQKP